ncbi:hypothetical protein BHE74_00021743 [Ensete ventricosum]|nr:hypothetical protein BHE74_00021743 [Ensete ventricosum]
MEEWCCVFGCVVGFGAVAEESTRPGLCRVCKLVHVGRGQGRSVQNGSASRESAPWVGSFGLCMSRCLLRGTYTKASSGWGTQCDPSDVRVIVFVRSIEMVSSPSPASGFSYAPSSLLVPPPRAGGRHSSGSKSGQSEPYSLSSGVITQTDIKAFQALEVMKSCVMTLTQHLLSSPWSWSRSAIAFRTSMPCMLPPPDNAHMMLAAVELHASEAQALVDHLKVELEKADRRRASLEMERENYHLDLADS